jgi:RNA polymerase sigma-70 factor (ECF subfamily)
MELQPTATSSTNLAGLLHTANHAHVPTRFGETRRDSRSGEDGALTSSAASRLVYARASDEQLIVAAKSSDDRAFEELSRRYVPLIRKMASRIVRNREDAEDIVQDSLLKAYNCLPKFKESCAFSSWITKIAINTSLMLLRKRKSRPEVSFDQPFETSDGAMLRDFAHYSPNSERTYARQQAIDVLSRAVDRLPSAYRSIVDLFHIQEKSVRETANSLGITVASAKSRLFRARRLLRTRLASQQISIFDACQ